MPTICDIEETKHAARQKFAELAEAHLWDGYESSLYDAVLKCGQFTICIHRTPIPDQAYEVYLSDELIYMSYPVREGDPLLRHCRALRFGYEMAMLERRCLKMQASLAQCMKTEE